MTIFNLGFVVSFDTLENVVMKNEKLRIKNGIENEDFEIHKMRDR